MKNFLQNMVILLMLVLPLPGFAQDAAENLRAAEMEAKRQTEKLQKELSLTPEQSKAVYDINLKYALERKQTSSRSDAVNLIKKKDNEIGRVLDSRQNSMLRSKRGEPVSVEIGGERSYLRTQPRNRTATTNSRQQVSSENRPVRSGRVNENASPARSRENVIRSTSRPVRQNFETGTRQQTRPASRVTTREQRTTQQQPRSSVQQRQNPSQQRSSTPARQSSGRTGQTRQTPERR